MDFATLPPEVNSGLMYSGPGSGPILTAGSAWDGMAAELEAAASRYQSVVATLAEGPWRGPSSAAMVAAAAPYVAWMTSTAAQAEQAATQAKAAAAAYETAFAMTVPPPVIATNRAQLAALVATNFLGQNTAAIAATEALYSEMWAQDAAVMYGYAGSAAAATELTPFTPPKHNTNSAGLDNQAASVMQTAGNRAQSTASSTVHGPMRALTGPSGLSGKGLLNGASTGVGNHALGLYEDTAGLGMDGIGLGGLDGGGLGVDLIGLGLESLGADTLTESSGLGALGSLGALGPLGGLGVLGNLGIGASAASATASMGEAASLGSLSVPPVWTVAAPMHQVALASTESSAAVMSAVPSAIRQVAVASTESSAAIASAIAAGAGAPYTDIALAGMAGRAMAGAAGRGVRERAGMGTHERLTPTEKPLDEPTTRIGIVAELRGLAELRDSGILTAEEFNQQKQRLLEG